MAYHIDNPECFGYGNMTSVENGMGGCRLLMFASGAPPRMRCLPLTIICMTTFPANITLFPFLRGQELKTGILRIEKCRKILNIKLFKRD